MVLGKNGWFILLPCLVLKGGVGKTLVGGPGGGGLEHEKSDWGIPHENLLSKPPKKGVGAAQRAGLFTKKKRNKMGTISSQGVLGGREGKWSHAQPVLDQTLARRHLGGLPSDVRGKKDRKKTPHGGPD